MMKMDDAQNAYWDKISSTALTSAMDDSEVRLCDIKGKFLLTALVDQKGALSLEKLEGKGLTDFLLNPRLVVAVVVSLEELGTLLRPLAIGMIRTILRERLSSMTEKIREKGKDPPQDLSERFLVLLAPELSGVAQHPEEGMAYLWLISPQGEILGGFSGAEGLEEVKELLNEVLDG